MYLKKAELIGHPGYTDLDILYGKDAVVPDGWEKVSSDLNESVKGEYVYLIAKNAQIKPPKITDIYLMQSKEGKDRVRDGYVKVF